MPASTPSDRHGSNGQYETNIFERCERTLRQAVKADSRSHPHIAVAILHDGEHGVARETGAQRRALDRGVLICRSNTPQTVAERANPEHVLPVVHQPIAGSFECVRWWTGGAELTKACCNVGRPDVSLAVLVDSPHMLVRDDAEYPSCLRSARTRPSEYRPTTCRCG